MFNTNTSDFMRESLRNSNMMSCSACVLDGNGSGCKITIPVKMHRSICKGMHFIARDCQICSNAKKCKIKYRRKQGERLREFFTDISI